MNLQEKIQGEFKEAFKAKDQIKLSTLKMLISEIKNEEIKKRSSGSSAQAGGEEKLSDDEVLTIITREIKKRKESIEIYDREGRVEQADQEKSELEVLSSYLPEQLSLDEIKSLIQKAIEQSGASNIKEMGKVMGILAPQIKGKADGSEVSRIVKESLS